MARRTNRKGTERHVVDKVFEGFCKYRKPEPAWAYRRDRARPRTGRSNTPTTHIKSSVIHSNRTGGAESYSF